jgi:hypothetical protein
MSRHRTAYFASTLLTGFACLVLGACSFSTQAGSDGPKSPSHERREKRPKRVKDESAKKHKDSGEKKRSEEKKASEQKDPPKKSEPETPKDAPLSPGMSRIIVPVNTSLKALQAKLEEELPNNEAQKAWKRVGKKSKNREIDIRYEIWREPIELSVKEHTLRVVVPVQYASEFRAKVDKPVGKGKIWLTHGETWGTKERKQTMKVTLDFNLKVNENYELESHSKLVSIDHGAPPDGKACTDTAVKICVPKKDLASHVEEELDEKIGRKIEKILKKGDKKIGKAFDLKPRVESVWSAMSTPVELQKANQANCPTLAGKICSRSAWLAFTPNTLGLSPLGLKGDDLGVRLSLEGKLQLSENKPQDKTPELPKLTTIGGGSTFELSTAFEIPIERLTERLDKALADTPLRVGGVSLKVKSLALRISDGEKKTLTLKLVTEKDHKLAFTTSLEFDPKKKLFALTRLVPDASTKAMLEKELKDLNLGELQKTIDDHATVALERASEALREAITSGLGKSLPAKFRLKGTLSEIALEDFSLNDKAIAAKVKLSGPLSIEILP